MAWPLSQDYNEAIQSPAGNFADPDLRRGEAVCNALGIPMPYSGNFADVYQVRCPDGSRWAVKCFTREALGLRERYAEISKHLRQVRPHFMVDFTYLEQGIVPRLPTAVLSTGLMIVAILSVASGLVLDTVTRGRREMKLIAYLAQPPAKS